MAADASRYRPFSISAERLGAEAAIVVAGDLDLASADTLEREFARQRADGVTRFVIDLSEVEFIDSTGLRVLLALRNDAKRHAHALTLIPPSPIVRRIFTITATRTLFDWKEDRGGS
jgi:anti-anti-sigma factor